MTYEYHTPVLVDEALHYLQAAREGIYVDGTVGGGGHAEAILRMTSPNSRLVGFDMDADAVSFAKRRLREFGERVIFVQDNFSHVMKRLREHSIDFADGVILDLGVSSHQIDDASRGFSFRSDNRLDMRMDRRQTMDGWRVVNTYPQAGLETIFRNYGEEKYSKRISRKILERRKEQSIDSTEDLSQIIESAVGRRFLQKSLARIFQAIRIEVNNEMENLRLGITAAADCLRSGGRIVVISYHSLEDRIVKQYFAKESRKSDRPANKLLPDITRIPRLALLTKKPVTANEDELSKNPRARSAKLRAAEKIER
jgi:16S rRNA (cytosine1402-N4)-methyltransferase